MASPSPSQQLHPFPEYSAQPPLQPVSSIQDLRGRQTQSYLEDSANQLPEVAPPPIYIQPEHGGAPGFAELPAEQVISSLPTHKLRTSTSRQQLNEDEQLARKLQEMEVQEARSRSNSELSVGLRETTSQYSLNSSRTATPPGSLPLPSQPFPHRYEQGVRPHSVSLSSMTLPRDVRSHSGSLSSSTSTPIPRSSNYAQASELQLSRYVSPEDLAPEVTLDPASTAPEVFVSSPVQTPQVFVPSPVSLNGSIAPQPPPYTTHVDPTSHLPVPPTDPTSLSVYLERHRQVPYPPQWMLPPVTQTLYGSFTITPKSEWPDVLATQTWRRARATYHAKDPIPPSYKLSFETHGGLFRNPQMSWRMEGPGSFSSTGKSLKKDKKAWSYTVKTDMKTSMRLEEKLQASNKTFVQPMYVHGANYDSLKFIGPDGKNYKWVSHLRVSSLYGRRYDSIRHALFVSTQRYGSVDPLFGQIVADHTFWDGYVDEDERHDGIACGGCFTSPIVGQRWKCRTCPSHDICDKCHNAAHSVLPTCRFTLVALPDEALYIRSEDIDVDMVVATLQVLKDWEKVTMREERRKDLTGFNANTEILRKGDLGHLSYWRATDSEGKDNAADTRGTVMAAHKADKDAKKHAKGKHGGHRSEFVGVGEFADGSVSTADAGGSYGSGHASDGGQGGPRNST